ncbi:MAG: hydrogenase maturation nickel metallochaperone HypA [Spirochaetaceae bacterium]|nr:MAG: hydrogenase maturation nickel metallochaperone HypA [Spirochaetaceae bacterium]
MHELAVTEAIVKLVLDTARRERARRVVTVNLRIGEMSDLKAEWIQRYFDHLAVGTIAAGARILVETTVPSFQCDHCGERFSRSLRGVESITCPRCESGSCTLTGGMEYLVENVEIEG